MSVLCYRKCVQPYISFVKGMYTTMHTTVQRFGIGKDFLMFFNQASYAHMAAFIWE